MAKGVCVCRECVRLTCVCAVRWGYGDNLYSNGDRYIGQYVEGLKEGYGIYCFAGGDVHVGEYRRGKRNGLGMWMTPGNPTLFIGGFKDDQFHGYGMQFDGVVWQKQEWSADVLVWAKDAALEGAGAASLLYRLSRMGVVDTECAVLCADTDVYVGQANRLQKRHGYGAVFDVPTRTFYIGAFENGVRHGRATVMLSGGDSGAWVTQMWDRGKLVLVQPL